MRHYPAELLIFSTNCVEGFCHSCKTCFNLFSVIICSGRAADGLCIIFVFLFFRGHKILVSVLFHNMICDLWATACWFRCLKLMSGLSVPGFVVCGVFSLSIRSLVVGLQSSIQYPVWLHLGLLSHLIVSGPLVIQVHTILPFP